MNSSIAIPDESSRPVATRREQSAEDWLWKVVLFPASLKFTLVLLAAAIFLIFVGTLAQAEVGMWDVLAQYFKSAIVFMQLRVFFPKVWFPEWHETIAPNLGFWFPGGMTIGIGMMANLFFAHLFKFRMQASGPRLLSGIIALSFGMLLTYVVVALGQFQQGLRAQPVISWQLIAIFTVLAMVAITVSLFVIAGMLTAKALSDANSRTWPKAFLCFGAAFLSAAVCALLYVFQNDVSAVRILWQLIQGTIAALVLLGACWLLFEKRAGIVLLHGGLALMMTGEALVSYQAKEEQMVIVEGETANFAHDIRVAELAIMENAEEEEKHIVVPQYLLTRAANSELNGKRLISNPQLPFDVEVLEFYQNAGLEDPEKGSANLATKGIGQQMLAVPKAVNSGADSNSEVDLPAAYVKITNRETGADLGTYLAAVVLSLNGTQDRVKVGGKTYDISLRFERDYKPYSIALKDFRRENYPGSNTPKKYESTIQMVDQPHGVNREVLISMNNPFRYLGETFYQSGFGPPDARGRESTKLQIVTNSGWMIPYVSCMIVLVGLMFQLGRTLLQFLQNEVNTSDDPETDSSTDRWSHLPAGHRPAVKNYPLPDPTSASEAWVKWFIPSWAAGVMVLLTLAIMAVGLRMPKPKADQFDYYAFGKIAVMSGGRAKPIDSLARETMLAMSNRITFKDAKDKSQPAVAWLLESMAHPHEAAKLRVLRLENDEVARAIGLEKQADFRYSMAEIIEHIKEFEEQRKQLADKPENKYTPFDNQLLQLDRRLQARGKTVTAFEIIDFAEMLDLKEFEKKSPAAMQQFNALAGSVADLYERLDKSQAPLALPFKDAKLQEILKGKQWLPLSVAMAMYDLQQLNPNSSGVNEPQSITLWRKIISAYRNNQPAEFNDAVAAYHDWFSTHAPSDCKVGRIALESSFNQFNPFGWTQGILLYLLAIVVSVLGLLAFRNSLGKAAFWMLLVIFLMHTGALIARMYIAGRPPVTNLYSSAVFIGWATVLFGLVLEAGFRLGVGNLLAAIGGMASLLIAYNLSFEGDTIGVMQAVLDTQFWLATHVVCITLGYAATYAAGFLGIFYILLGLFTSQLHAAARKELASMIYGIVSFALLLSFFGTVLGGLWADDSWGRFWGWDPKENGALIIVLWNAFILHARWDKLARERGLAVLAVVGNIVTTWSWFGTNQLGVGLHSYGFTKGVLEALALTVLVHIIFIILGCLPRSLWRSYREDNASSIPLPA